jgi:hypothetical protein
MQKCITLVYCCCDLIIFKWSCWSVLTLREYSCLLSIWFKYCWEAYLVLETLVLCIYRRMSLLLQIFLIIIPSPPCLYSYNTRHVIIITCPNIPPPPQQLCTAFLTFTSLFSARPSYFGQCLQNGSVLSFYVLYKLWYSVSTRNISK